MLLLSPPNVKHKVSSVLNRSSEFAGKHMFSDDACTMWNSDQGCPQWILINFDRPVIVQEVRFTFQGGFVGQDGTIEIGDSISELTVVDSFEPEDVNDEQIFSVASSSTSTLTTGAAQFLRINFKQSTDFYGRTTIYRLAVYGVEMEEK
jgi:hypothetical protein